MILITGAKGYVGRNLHIPNAIRVDKEVEITELNRLQRGQIEGIIHLAAISRVKHCEANPVQAVQTNVTGVTAVLELARRKKAWVIFVSSLEARFPKNIYGHTKNFCERLCGYYATKYNLRILIIRLGDVYGNDDHQDKAIPTIYELAKQGKDIILINPQQEFVPLHIDIVVRNIKKLVVVAKRLSKGTYEVREIISMPRTLLHLTELMLDLTKSKSKIIIKEVKNVGKN